MKLEPRVPEILMEAALLGVFMFSACVFASLLEDPSSPVRIAAGGLLGDAFVRRCLMGAAMGLTAVAIFYSPWAKRSGAHINPAVTLTFWNLGRIGARDGALYALAQFVGGALGVLAAGAAVRGALGMSAVDYAVTRPGPSGAGVAILAEVGICFAMMGTVLLCQSYEGLKRYGGLACAVLLALFIVFESPLSGTSLNPARTFASAVVSGMWTDAWVYFVAPPLGMLAAAELYRRVYVDACNCPNANPGFAALFEAAGHRTRTAP